MQPKFLCSDCDHSNAGGMTKFLANFLIASPITINDFRVSMQLTFRAGLLTDLRPCGFFDASTAAFAAAVYLDTINIDSSVTVSLLVVKSKMASLKTISVPRLELSAALLLARLMHFTCSALQLSSSSVIARQTSSLHSPGWVSHLSDRKSLSRKPISAVQSLLPGISWRHVPTHTHTHTNTHTHQSRGLRITRLALFETHVLCWSGSPWSPYPPESWLTFGTLRCYSRTMIRNSGLCIARYTKLGSRVMLFFVAKIVNYLYAYLYRFLNRLRHSKKFAN